MYLSQFVIKKKIWTMSNKIKKTWLIKKTKMKLTKMRMIKKMRRRFRLKEWAF